MHDGYRRMAERVAGTEHALAGPGTAARDRTLKVGDADALHRSRIAAKE